MMMMMMIMMVVMVVVVVMMLIEWGAKKSLPPGIVELCGIVGKLFRGER